MNVLTLPAFKQAKIVSPHKAGAKDEINCFYNYFRYSLSGVKFLNAFCLIEFFLLLNVRLLHPDHHSFRKNT